MDATVIGAFIGVGGGIVGVFIGVATTLYIESRRDKQEQTRWTQSQKDQRERWIAEFYVSRALDHYQAILAALEMAIVTMEAVADPLPPDRKEAVAAIQPRMNELYRLSASAKLYLDAKSWECFRAAREGLANEYKALLWSFEITPVPEIHGFQIEMQRAKDRMAAIAKNVIDPQAFQAIYASLIPTRKEP